MSVSVKVKKLHPDAVVPKYATPGAACFDLHAVNEELVISQSSAEFDTGLAFEIPEGHVMLVFSRSGHGFKSNIRLANSTAVIDSDYRGKVRVKLTNDDLFVNFMVRKGDRIAQAMIVPIPAVTLDEVTELSTTERGEGGFGSTGK